MDHSRWDQAFRAYHHRILVSLIAAGVRADRAAEIAQATWTRLIEQDMAGRLTEIRLPGLALAQARLLALAAHRSDTIAARRTAPETAATEIAAEDDPERQALGREELQRTIAVIAAASPSAQRVFQLAYGEPPLSQAEVAEHLGLSLQRVRQILCEMRKKLREALEP